MTYKELVNVLIHKRKQYKVDTMAVSQIVGVADSLVGDWERIKKIPSAINLIAWCEALEVEISLIDHQTLPPEFEATPETILWTKQLGVNYDEEREKFIDYYTAQGRTARNWNAMFKLWVRRSIEFREKSGRNFNKLDKTSSDFVRDRRSRIINISNVQDNFLKRKR